MKQCISIKKILLLPILFLLSVYGYGQVTRVNHVSAHIVGAEDIYKLFNQRLGLPVVFPFQSFGSFSSGGLWMGNITFETVEAGNGDVNAGRIKGIALEPTGNTDAIVLLLDKMKITHSNPDVSYWDFNGSRQKFYTITDLTDLSSDKRRVFICDYEQRGFINSFSAKANSALKATRGGVLGLIGVNTIVIQTTDVPAQTKLWKTLPGIKVKGDGRVEFDMGGPEILIEPGTEDCVKEIVLTVRSTANAAAFLAKENYLKKEGNTLLIDPGKAGGLRILIEE